jgi:hypothetical protein
MAKKPAAAAKTGSAAINIDIREKDRGALASIQDAPATPPKALEMARNLLEE